MKFHTWLQLVFFCREGNFDEVRNFNDIFLVVQKKHVVYKVLPCSVDCLIAFGEAVFHWKDTHFMEYVKPW